MDVLSRHIGHHVEKGVQEERQVHKGTVARINAMTEVHVENGGILNLRSVSRQFLSIGGTGRRTPEKEPDENMTDALQKDQVLLDTSKSTDVVFDCGLGTLAQLSGPIKAIHDTTVQFD
ncbi:MAG: hypothetical protein VX589_17950 [Myxococcota bacterium]|nr:hypothetical protein [Myxococcota bacterium]